MRVLLVFDGVCSGEACVALQFEWTMFIFVLRAKTLLQENKQTKRKRQVKVGSKAMGGVGEKRKTGQGHEEGDGKKGMVDAVETELIVPIRTKMPSFSEPFFRGPSHVLSFRAFGWSLKRFRHAICLMLGVRDFPLFMTIPSHDMHAQMRTLHIGRDLNLSR